MTAPATISLSLLSHTNAGKTTLARTLLAQSVGEVRDAPHVTVEATPYPMLETPEGDALILWDTPGFGDSVRLAKRLRQQGNPVGWLLSEVWDRYRDRTFWLNQVAVRNVREQADVVLYLVNAAEVPGDAGWLAPELALLDWIAKPVIVLLNQTGLPGASADEAAAEARWREALQGWPLVRAALTLDAFARCWVQEFALFDTVAPLLPPAKQEAYGRLAAGWHARRMAQFDAAIEVLAAPIARAALDRETLPPASLRDKVVRAIGRGRESGDDAQAQAMRALAARFEADAQAGTQRLIEIHGLVGTAVAEVLARAASDVRTDAPVDEGKAALMSGVVSGALTGVAVDLAHGGLTFGAGLLTGAVLGALGGAGVARGFNVIRGKSEVIVRWDDAFLDGQVASALLRYLAVAHYGRGRGDWRDEAPPLLWRERVTAMVAAKRPALKGIWGIRGDNPDSTPTMQQLKPLLLGAARELLDELYPGALASGGARRETT